jgi:hypothetical protein
MDVAAQGGEVSACRIPAAAVLALLLCACTRTAGPEPALAGAWRSQVRFSGGPFAAVKDLEFMYAVHADGTLTESSNYDAAPPVPPAYGVWRKVAPGRFQLHYEFYVTAAKAGADLKDGWPPSGRGLLDEAVVLAPDGKSFTSQIRLTMIQGNAPATDGGAATGSGRRIGF